MAFNRKTETIDIGRAKELLESAERSLSGNLRAERFYNEIKETLERLRKDTERLKKAKPKYGISDALRIRGVPNRDIMVSNLSAVLKVPIPEGTDYRTALFFYNEASAALATPFGKLSYNIRFVRAVFPEEVKAVVSDIKKLRALLEHLIAPVRRKEDIIEAIDRCKEIIEEIEALSLSGGSDADVSTEDLERRIEYEKGKIRDAKSSEQWMKQETLKRDLSLKKEKLKRMEDELEAMVAPIRKTLSLLKKEDETGKRTLLPEEGEAVNALLFSPLETILSGSAKETLSLVRKFLEDDTVINTERKERALRDMETILKTDFSSSAKEIEDLRKEIEDAEKEISNTRIEEDIGRMERSVGDLERELKRARSDKERSERHKTSTDRERSENLRELSDLLSRITKRRIDVRA